MENASVCNRPKRVRKDCSPTKLPKTVSVEQSPGDVGTIPEEKSGNLFKMYICYHI